MRPLLFVVFAVSAASCATCVDRESDEKQIDPAYIEKNLIDEVPGELDHRVEADLGGHVVYVGNRVMTESPDRGEELRVVHYWKVLDPPGDAWRVFAHAESDREGDWLNVDASDMRIGHPPKAWSEGDIIRDEQVFEVPEDWGDYVDLRVGLYLKGGKSAGDRMSIESGPADGDSRVQAARIPLGDAAPEAPEPYVLRRAGGAIEIDGRAEEPAWERAPESPAFAAAEGGREMPGESRGRLLWDEDALYAFIEVEDPSVYSEYEEDGDPLWKQDAVEIFIDADRSGQGYIELQVNPRGARYDSFFRKTRAEGGDAEWESNMRAAVKVRGDPEEPDSEDEGWSAEIAIPLEAVKGRDSDMDVDIPPELGDRWNLNLVRVEGLEEDSVTASSWSRISISDFHALDRMFTVVFVDEEGKRAQKAMSEAGEAFEDGEEASEGSEEAGDGRSRAGEAASGSTEAASGSTEAASETRSEAASAAAERAASPGETSDASRR